MKKSVGSVSVILVMAFILGGCAVRSSRDTVVIDPKPAQKGGGFCPPGQAKKGNC